MVNELRYRIMINEFLWPELQDMDVNIVYFEQDSAVINEVEPEMCENIIENFIKRSWFCKRSRVGHLNDIVFHY